MSRARVCTAAWLGVLLALLAGCSSTHQGQVNVLGARIGRDHRPTYLGLPLHTGQVVLSEAPGAYSFFFSLVPARFFTFTHAGLLVMEGGEPYVYDVSGRYKPGFDARPTDGIVGEIRRQRFVDYCAPNLYVEVFDPPAGVDAERVAAACQRRYAEGVDFDAYFRYDEHERLFCTEFVQLTLEEAGAPALELVPIRQNPSLLTALRWLAVPLDTALPAGLYWDPERYVGAVGQFRNQVAAHCYFAEKREIHRRFTDSQKLGNVFEMKANAELELRPEITAFLHEAEVLFMGAEEMPALEEIDARVQALARRTFGPLGAGSEGGAAGSAGPSPRAEGA